MAHLTPEQAARWHSGSLQPEEILRVDDHLAECEPCRTLLGEGRSAENVAAAVERELVGVRQRHDHGADGEFEGWARESSRVRTRRKWGVIAIAASLLAAAGVLLRTPQRARPRVAATTPVAAVARAFPPVSLKDGDLVLALDRKKALGVTPMWRRRVEAILLHPELDAPAVALQVSRRAETQRGDGARAAPPVRPVAPLSVVVDNRPTFRWTGRSGARYRVQIFDPTFSPLATSPNLEAREWRPESGLPRGEILSWSIVEVRDGRERAYPEPPAPPAVFEIVSVDAAREIEAARRTRSRLVSGLALWQAGAVDEAASELEKLRHENPGIPVIEQLAASSARIAREFRRGEIGDPSR